MTEVRTQPGGLAADQKRVLRAALVYASRRNEVVGVWRREARGLVPPRLAPTTHEMTRRVLRGHGTPAQEQAVRITLFAYVTALGARHDSVAHKPPRVEPLHGWDLGQTVRWSTKKPLEPGEDPDNLMVPRFDALWRAVHSYHGDPDRIQKAVIELCKRIALYGVGLSYVRLADDLSVVLGEDPEEATEVTQRWMRNRLGLNEPAERSAA